MDMKSGDILPSHGGYTPLQPQNSPRRPSWVRRVLLVTGILSLGFLLRSYDGRRLGQLLSILSLNSEIVPQEITLPAGVSTKDCVPWIYDEFPDEDGYLFKAHTSLQLPIDTPSLFFLKAGSTIVGGFHVIQVDEISDSAKIDITLKTRQEDMIDLTSICSLVKEGGGDGLGILADFPPRRESPKERIDIVVSLPKSSTGDPLEINSFESTLSFVAHEFKLDDSVFFHQLLVSGTAIPLSVETIVADEVRVDNGISPISGTFNISDALFLKTTTGAIDVTANLFNDPSAEKSTSLDLLATVGAITGTINLYSQSQTETGAVLDHADTPSFDIRAQASVTPIHLSLPFIHPGTILNISTKATLGSTLLELHESFEGRFSIQTGRFRGQASVTVRNEDEVDDPEGRGRKRVVEFARKTTGSIQGRVGWGQLVSGKEGSVEIQTTFGNAELRL